ncbi:MAG: TRAP transporter small permease [Acidobacteriota bacterium]|nr:TRAP transporter small permease [Acidobacteriota bacterium]
MNRGLDNCVIGLTAILVVDVLWQVCSRYVFSSPSSWTEELATFLLIWVGLLGAAVAFREHAHLGIEYLPARMSPRIRCAVEVLALASTALFCVLVLVYGGATLVIRTVSLLQTSPALGLPMGYVYLALPVGGFFMTVYSLQFLTARLSHVPSADSSHR